MKRIQLQLYRRQFSAQLNAMLIQRCRTHCKDQPTAGLVCHGLYCEPFYLSASVFADIQYKVKIKNCVENGLQTLRHHIFKRFWPITLEHPATRTSITTSNTATRRPPVIKPMYVWTPFIYNHNVWMSTMHYMAIQIDAGFIGNDK